MVLLWPAQLSCSASTWGLCPTVLPSTFCRGAYTLSEVQCCVWAGAVGTAPRCVLLPGAQVPQLTGSSQCSARLCQPPSPEVQPAQPRASIKMDSNQLWHRMALPLCLTAGLNFTIMLPPPEQVYCFLVSSGSEH